MRNVRLAKMGHMEFDSRTRTDNMRATHRDGRGHWSNAHIGTAMAFLVSMVLWAMLVLALIP